MIRLRLRPSASTPSGVSAPSIPAYRDRPSGLTASDSKVAFAVA
jgi:hypothetical protein